MYMYIVMYYFIKLVMNYNYIVWEDYVIRYILFVLKFYYNIFKIEKEKRDWYSFMLIILIKIS